MVRPHQPHASNEHLRIFFVYHLCAVRNARAQYIRQMWSQHYMGWYRIQNNHELAMKLFFVYHMSSPK